MGARMIPTAATGCKYCPLGAAGSMEPCHTPSHATRSPGASLPHGERVLPVGGSPVDLDESASLR